MIINPKLTALVAKELTAKIAKAFNDRAPKYLKGQVTPPKRPKDMTQDELEELPLYTHSVDRMREPCSVIRLYPEDIIGFFDRAGDWWDIRWDGVENRWSRSY